MTEQPSRRRFPAIADGADTAVSYSVQFDLSRFTGTTLVVGDVVTLSDGGLSVRASETGADEAPNAYRFTDGGGADVGGLYGRADAAGRALTLSAAGDAAQNGALALLAAGAAATAVLGAARPGQAVDTAVTVTRAADESAVTISAGGPGGQVRVGPRLLLRGAAGESCTLYLQGSKLVIHYDDGGTERYKYLELSGETAVWAASTTPP